MSDRKNANAKQNYGVEVTHESGGCYTAYVDAFNEDHARRLVTPDMEKGERITGVYLNTPKVFSGEYPSMSDQQKVPSNSASGLLQALLDGPKLSTMFRSVAIGECNENDWIEDVPWDEKPHHKALRWFRITQEGRMALIRMNLPAPSQDKG